MSNTLRIFFVFLALAGTPSFALSPEAQADLLLIRAIEAIESEDFDTALENFHELAELDVAKPDAFLFHYGKTALKAGRFKIAYQMLEGYLDTVGSSGEFYQGALKLYIEAERGKESESQLRHARLIQARKDFFLCDELTASPYDLQAPEGRKFLDWSGFNSELAATTCRSAADAFPEEPRMKYQLAMALSYWDGIRAEQSSEANSLFEEAAGQGYAEAQYQVGHDYWFGQGGVTKNEQKALYWIELAAQQGSPRALRDIATAYWKGWLGLDVDKEKSLDLFKIAATTGVAGIQADVGLGLHTRGFEEDAVYWLEKAMENAERQKLTYLVYSKLEHYLELSNSRPIKGIEKVAAFYLRKRSEVTTSGARSEVILTPADIEAGLNQEDFDAFGTRIRKPEFARAVQTELATLGFYSGAIDGVFGAGSMAALRAYCGC